MKGILKIEVDTKDWNIDIKNDSEEEVKDMIVNDIKQIMTEMLNKDLEENIIIQKEEIEEKFLIEEFVNESGNSIGIILIKENKREEFDKFVEEMRKIKNYTWKNFQERLKKEGIEILKVEREYQEF